MHPSYNRKRLWKNIINNDKKNIIGSASEKEQINNNNKTLKTYDVYFLLNKIPSVCTINLRRSLKGGSSLFDILKGVRQGGFISPSVFNNSVLHAQSSVNFSCIYRGFNCH